MAEMATKKTTKRIPVVITTKHRGVFFGYIDPKEAGDEVLHVTDKRVCLYWPREVRGFLGLASDGPLSGSRVSKAVPEAFMRDVTDVVVCTPKAAERWEAGPWA